MYNPRYVFLCIIFHVRRGMEICRLVLYDLGIFQVRLDVRVRKNLKVYKFLFLPLFDVIFNRLSSFLQSTGLINKSLSVLL